MIWLITKYLMTAAVVVVVSEVAKRSDKLGAMIAALPLVTLLALIWLHVENQPAEKVANHAWYTFWYVVPTLPMFLALPFLLPRIGFWLALGQRRHQGSVLRDLRLDGEAVRYRAAVIRAAACEYSRWGGCVKFALPESILHLESEAACLNCI